MFGGDKCGPAPKDSKPEYLTPFDSDDLNTNPRGGNGRGGHHGHDDEDSEEGHSHGHGGRGGGQRAAECAMQ